MISYDRSASAGEYEKHDAAQWTNPVGGSPQATGTTVPSCAGVKKSYMKGQNVPHFHKRKREGDLLPYTHWLQVFREGSYHGISDQTYTGGVRTWWENNLFSTYDQSLAFLDESHLESYIDEDISNRVIQEAAANIGAATFDALTFLVELHKTRDLFSQSVKNLKRALKRTPKTGRGKTQQTLGKFGKKELEAKYGWGQVFYDVEDIKEAVGRLHSKTTRIRGKAKANSIIYDDQSREIDHGNGWVSSVTDIVSGSVEYVGRAIADIRPPTIGANPAITLWETLKFSFIVDWFIGVGTWLDAMQLLALSTAHHSCTGVLVTGTRTYIRRGIQAPNDVASYIEERYGESKVTLTRRTPRSVPLTLFQNLRFDEGKMRDILALLQQSR